jgi:hypothetical protein
MTGFHYGDKYHHYHHHQQQQQQPTRISMLTCFGDKITDVTYVVFSDVHRISTKAKLKIVRVLNQVPRHENVSMS